MTKIPRWNLDSIYTDTQCAEYKNDLNQLKELFVEMEELLSKASNGSRDFDSFLCEYIQKNNTLAALSKTIGAYAYIVYSTDTTDTKNLNNLNMIDDLETQEQQIYIHFCSVLFENKEKLPAFYKNHPDCEKYRYLFDEILTDKTHQMSAKEEELASKMSHTGGNAWSLLQEQIISNLHDSDGKTFNELRNDAYSPDPLMRKQSWEKEIKLLSQNKIAFAAALNNLKGETITLNKRRAWPSAIDKALFSSRMSRQTLDALISAIEDSLPLWRDYFKAKAKLLRISGLTESKTAGTEKYPGIAFYDLFAPVEEPYRNAGSYSTDSILTKTWDFEEAAGYVVKEYYSFSKDMGDFAKNAFEKGWIDAEVRKGKVGGAYDEDFPKGHQSRILSNFTGAFSDIITLAHELGHAYHFSCLKDKDPVFFDYPMTLAESASTFAETIVKQDMLSQSTGFDRIKIIDLDLTDVSQVLVDILCRFYFERSVFEEKEISELSAEDFCKLMQQAQDASYGDGLNSCRTEDDSNYSERHDYMWAVKSHYYITNLDFYNFPYAFGQLFAAGLYSLSRKQGPDFARTYAQILSDTGSMSCEDLCRKAGFDITTKEFWLNGIQMYAKEVQEYKDYIAKL